MSRFLRFRSRVGVVLLTLSIATATLADTDATADAKQRAREREMFAQANELAGKVESGRYGLAIWEGFLEEFPDGALADAAKAQRDIWKPRADGNLVRFGKAWLPVGEVAERNAKVDRLLEQAAALDDPDRAMALCDEAARVHPHRVDVPFAKAEAAYRGKREREFGLALGEVLKIDPGHVAARNNLGVLMAVQKDWAASLANLSKVAEGGENDTALDNLDQVIALCGDEAALATMIAHVKSRSAATAAAMLKAGKHAGMARWGNTWIDVDRHEAFVRENEDIDRQIKEARGKLDDLDKMRTKAQEFLRKYGELRREYEESLRRARATRKKAHFQEKITEIDKMRDEANEALPRIEEEKRKQLESLENLPKQKHQPAYSRTLLLLAADGQSLLGTIWLDGPPQNKPQRDDHHKDGQPPDPDPPADPGMDPGGGNDMETMPFD